MDKPERKPLRLKEYDYSQNGAYFVTICTKDRKPLFGHIVGAAHPGGPHVELSELGQIVEHHLTAIPLVYQAAALEHYIIMPDHIHFILSLDQAGPPGCAAPTSLPKIVSALKSLCTRSANTPLWQRGYYEHVIRNQADFDAAAEYILTNPIRRLERQTRTP